MLEALRAEVQAETLEAEFAEQEVPSYTLLLNMHSLGLEFAEHEAYSGTLLLKSTLFNVVQSTTRIRLG